MMRRILVLGVLIALGVALWPLILGAGIVNTPAALPSAYLDGAPKDFATANVVTAIVVSYRGFDTLGEVAVLFAATAGVGSLLSRKRLGTGLPPRGRRHGTEILGTASRLLSSLLVMFGVYILDRKSVV